jgi:hypothetical protein
MVSSVFRLVLQIILVHTNCHALSAVGATQFSPARKRWVTVCAKRTSACAALPAKAFVRAEATLSLPSKFLIANPRLTLRVNAIRIEPSSRRENVLVAQALLPVRCCQDFEPHGISFQNLIVTPRLEITISPILSISSNFLIVTKRTFFHPDSFAGADFCTLRPPKTRIQCGREGESV